MPNFEGLRLREGVEGRTRLRHFKYLINYCYRSGYEGLARQLDVVELEYAEDMNTTFAPVFTPLTLGEVDVLCEKIARAMLEELRRHR